VSKIYESAPCANSDDKDAWFVNRKGRLEPEDAKEIRARHSVESDAQAEIDELERNNRRRLREAIRACYFECPMATRLHCLEAALDGDYLGHGVRGGYMPAEIMEMRRLREEHKTTGKRVASVAISQERREALAEATEERENALSGGGEPDSDQPPARTQPQVPEDGPTHHDSKETP